MTDSAGRHEQGATGAAYRLEIVSIPAQPALDGLLYTPVNDSPLGGVLLFHGNTMNFYVGAPRFLPPTLAGLGYASLAFNRRSHDILSTRDSRNAEGGAYQIVGQDIADNEAAAAYLAARGYAAPIVIGHSNGGTLAAAFAARHPETRALILLSAHRGGGQIIQLMGRAGLLAGADHDAALERARELVALGRPDELMLLPGWWYAISAAGLLDRADNTPDLLASAPDIRCPTLFMVGDEEPADLYPAERFAELTASECRVEVLPDCGHFYVGSEGRVTQLVSDWMELLDQH